jgi:hypothetical protein
MSIEGEAVLWLVLGLAIAAVAVAGFLSLLSRGAFDGSDWFN